MRNSPRSLPARLSPFAITMVSLLAVGCGEERLYDDPYGYVDLAPFFFDGATLSDPIRAIPRDLVAHKGWVNGVRAEYYDFGLVGRVNKRTSSSTPDYAVVHPMYFFFDHNRKPMFSRPVWEARTGLWHLKGGKNVLDPNPAPNARRDLVYPQRPRLPLIDKARGTADYQRPIIDRLNNDANYSGLWEVWEVIAPEGYDPDAIKSWETLEKGVEAGDFGLRRTLKVINCPMIDDRTYVQPSAMYYNIPRPRMEVWYRTKQGACFLVNGWETLGTVDPPVPFDAARPNTRPGTGDDERRLDTFDLIRYTIGEGTAARTTVVAPIGKMWQPTVVVVNQDPSRSAIELRYVDNFLTDALPRQFPDDPPGYRPVRWMWDITVPQDPPFEFGTFRRVETIDPAQLKARSGTWTRNFPLVGAAVPCKEQKDCNGLFAAPGVEMVCNPNPSPELAVNDLPPGIPNIAELQLRREGGPRCDVPEVRFGEYCSPGIARCSMAADNRNQDISMVTDETSAPLPAVSRKFKQAMPGYACAPNPTGYCYQRCDSDASSSGAPSSVTIELPYKAADGSMKTDRQAVPYDPRCGNVPGFRCVSQSGSGIPARMKVCMRTCSTSRAENFNQQFCQLPIYATLNENVNDVDISKGWTCSSAGMSEAVCQWNVAYEPRDPKTNFVPGQ